ncbi:hypothetical protein Tco_0066522 [Tanacetum coccineum]
MSDSEHSTVTYTSISSDDGSLDVGSLGVIVLGYNGLPMMPKDPYAYVEAAMQEQPSPDFVPEPVYLEFMTPEDDVLLAQEQPLPVAVLPTTDSPDDDDNEEEEELSEDDADDKEEEEDEDEEEEEEEHLSLVEVDRLLSISTPPPSQLTSYSSLLPHIPSPPLPVSLPLPISPPPLSASPTHPLGYRAAMIRLRAESPSTSHPLPLPLPLPIVLPHTRASMAMMRATVPSAYILAPRSETQPSGTPPLLPIPLPTSSPPLLLPSIYYRADIPEVTLPLWKRLCIALDPIYEVGKCSFAPNARPTRGFRADYGLVGTLDAKIRRDPDREIGYEITDIWDTNEIYGRLDDAQDDRLLMSGQLTLLHRDMRSHARTTRLMEGEDRDPREAWVQSMDASDMERSEVRALWTTVLAQQTEIGDLLAADRRRQAQLAEALTLLRTLQTQMVALQSQQRPARDLTHPDVPEEAGSSS